MVLFLQGHCHCFFGRVTTPGTIQPERSTNPLLHGAFSEEDVFSFRPSKSRNSIKLVQKSRPVWCIFWVQTQFPEVRLLSCSDRLDRIHFSAQNPFPSSPFFSRGHGPSLPRKKTKQKKKRVNSRRDSKVEQDLHRTRTETPVTEKPVKKHRLTSVVSHRSTAGSTRSTGSPRHGPRDRRRPQKGGRRGRSAGVARGPNEGTGRNPN